jgi:hypothetical protein
MSFLGMVSLLFSLARPSSHPMRDCRLAVTRYFMLIKKTVKVKPAGQPATKLYLILAKN